MPLLAAFFGNLIGGLVTFFGQYITKKVTILAAAISSLVAAGLALVVAFNTLIKPLAERVFTTEYGQFLGLAFPPVAGQCLTTMFLFWMAIQGYKFKVMATKMTASGV
jgi:hypothetical protein